MTISLALALAACGQLSYTVEEHLERGVDFEQQGNLSAASIEYKNVLQKDPANAEGRFRLGMVLLRTGDLAGAEGELSRAQELGWDSDELRLPLIRVDLLQGRYGRVMDETRLFESFPEAQVPEALTLRGQALLGMGNAREAGAVFREALDLQADRAEAKIGLAVVALSLQEGSDVARSWVESALESDPQSPQAWGLKGDLERQDDRLEQAEVAYGRAIQYAVNPYFFHVKRALTRLAREDIPAMEEDLRAMRRLAAGEPAVGYVQGLMYYHKGRYAEAQSAFEESLSRAPDFQPAVFLLGASHYAQGNWQQAEYHLGRYVRAHPDSNDAARLLAAVRVRQGDLGRAEQLLLPVLGRNPDDVLALTLIGNVYLAGGRYSEGIEHLRQVTSLAPEDPASRVALATGLLQAGELEEGLREFEAALEQAPGEHRLEATYILNLIQERQFESALSAAARLSERLPDSPLPHNLKAAAYFGIGDVERTRVSLREALRVAPGDPASTTNLAQIERHLGNEEEVRRLYREALRAHPGHPDISLRYARLLAQQGEVETSRRLLEESIGQYPEALEPRLVLAQYYLLEREPRRALALLEPVRQSAADDLRFLDVLVRAQLATGQKTQAVDTLRALSGKLPRSASAHHRLGYGFEQADRPSEARSHYLKALELEPGHTGALPNLALLELREGRMTEAMNLARRMQGEAGIRAAGHALEARIHAASGRQDDAIASLEEAYELQPATVHAVALGQLYAAAQGPEKAVALFRNHLSQQPEEESVRILLAETLAAMGEYATAIEEYEHLAVVYPRDASILNNLAYLYVSQGDERALDYAERAYALSPDEPAVAHTLGWILVNRGDVKRGLPLLGVAHDADPERPEVWYHYAVALVKAGRAPEARGELTELLGKVDDFPQRADAERLLESLE